MGPPFIFQAMTSLPLSLEPPLLGNMKDNISSYNGLLTHTNN